MVRTKSSICSSAASGGRMTTSTPSPRTLSSSSVTRTASSMRASWTRSRPVISQSTQTMCVLLMGTKVSGRAEDWPLRRSRMTSSTRASRGGRRGGRVADPEEHLREADRLVGVAHQPAQAGRLEWLVGEGRDQALDGGDQQHPLQRLAGHDPVARGRRALVVRTARVGSFSKTAKPRPEIRRPGARSRCGVAGLCGIGPSASVGTPSGRVGSTPVHVLCLGHRPRVGRGVRVMDQVDESASFAGVGDGVEDRRPPGSAASRRAPRAPPAGRGGPRTACRLVWRCGMAANSSSTIPVGATCPCRSTVATWSGVVRSRAEIVT